MLVPGNQMLIRLQCRNDCVVRGRLLLLASVQKLLECGRTSVAINLIVRNPLSKFQEMYDKTMLPTVSWFHRTY